jgi:hypothetical protein
LYSVTGALAVSPVVLTFMQTRQIDESSMPSTIKPYKATLVIQTFLTADSNSGRFKFSSLH